MDLDNSKHVAMASTRACNCRWLGQVISAAVHLITNTDQFMLHIRLMAL